MPLKVKPSKKQKTSIMRGDYLPKNERTTKNDYVFIMLMVFKALN